MRKNNLLILCLVFFGVSLLDTSSVVSAAEAGKCILSSGPTPGLANYIKKLDSKLSTIKSDAGKITCNPSSLGASSAKLGTEITKIYNRESSFKNFTSSTNFWIYATVKSSLPPEFIRDYLLLQKQTEKIQKAMDSVSRGCSNPGAIKQLGDILSDHIKLMQYFQEIVTGTSNSSPAFAFIVMPPELPDEILDVYGSTAKISCINNSANTKMLSEFSAKVGHLSSAFKDSTKSWKEAFSLITGADKAAYSKVEKQLLKKELGRQGLSTQQSAAMLKKLGQSNKEQLGIGTFLQDIGDRIGTMAKSLASALDKVADDLYDAAKTPNVGTYMNRLREIDTARSIIAPSSPDSINIVADYNAMKALLSDENVALEQGISRARMMHETLNVTIADIKANIDIAKKTCDSQATGQGNC